MPTKISQGPWTRIRPLQRDELDPYTEAGMAIGEITWGRPGADFCNNLCKVMAYMPRMAQTEVEYCNAFIFDPPTFRGDVQETAFNDRPLKELVISRTSLINRSWYSITHHALLGWFAWKAAGVSDEVVHDKYVYLHEHEKHPHIYDERERVVLDYTVKVTADPHAISNEEFETLKRVLHEHNQHDNRIRSLPSEQQERHVSSQIAELTWLIGHFCLLNRFLTALQVPDEGPDDETNFLASYEETVPEVIRNRNADILAGKL